MTDSKVDFEVKTFEQQEKELDDENKKSQEIKKKAPIKDVIKNSSLDYHAGKALVHEKKDEVYHHMSMKKKVMITLHYMIIQKE